MNTLSEIYFIITLLLIFCKSLYVIAYTTRKRKYRERGCYSDCWYYIIINNNWCCCYLPYMDELLLNSEAPQTAEFDDPHSAGFMREGTEQLCWVLNANALSAVPRSHIYDNIWRKRKNFAQNIQIKQKSVNLLANQSRFFKTPKRCSTIIKKALIWIIYNSLFLLLVNKYSPDNG